MEGACTPPHAGEYDTMSAKVGGHRQAVVPSCSWRQYECGGVLGVVTARWEGRQIIGGAFICKARSNHVWNYDGILDVESVFTQASV